MKKLGLIFKETSQKVIKRNIQDAQAVFIVKYSGVKSPDLSALRQNLKSANAQLLVVKNSVARRSVAQTPLNDLTQAIEGPCGFVFINQEPVSVSKILCGFTKDHEQLRIEGGIIKDKLINKEAVLAMSKLPSREVLIAKLVMTLNAPISGLCMGLAQILRKFIYCLEQIKIKKENASKT